MSQRSEIVSVERTDTPRARLLAVAGLVVVMGFVALTHGLRAEHIVASLGYLALVAIGGRAFRFLLYFIPIPLTGIFYDFSRHLTELRLAEVHVADLYHAELRWFGVGSGADRQILSDLFTTHTAPFLDLICGFAYMAYLYVPMVVAGILFFFDQKRMLVVGWAFLLITLFGVATYLIYPAAPPWYVARYGLGPAQLDAPPDPAGALRFDALLGIDYFAGFYARSSNVFGAMPSLHVGYSMVPFVGTIDMGKKWSLPLGLFTALVAFAAIYLQHHYVWDVLMGAVYAVVSCLAVRAIVERLARRDDQTISAPELTTSETG